MRVRLGSHLLPLLAYGALALFSTLPAILQPHQVVIGAERSDVWNSLWSLWWVAESLAHGGLPFHTVMLDHPVGGRLMVADPVNTLLAAPFVRLWGPVLVYNLLVWFHLGLAALGAHALSRALGGSGWIAGVGYGFSAMMLSNAHNGASEALSAGWLPLACLALVGVVRKRGRLLQLLAGLLIFLCAAASWYNGVGAWMFLLGLVLLGLPGVDFRSRYRRLAVPAVLGLVFTLPLAWATRAVARAPDGLVAIKGGADVARLRRTLGSADPRIYFVPGDFRSPDFRVLEGNPSDYTHLAYLGWVLLVLASIPVFLWLWRQWRAGFAAPSEPAEGSGRPLLVLYFTAALGLVLAMGPVLVIGGFPYALASHALPLPYRALEAFPGFDALSLLYRLAGVAVLCIAVAADRALLGLLGSLRPWLRALVILTVMVLVCVEVGSLSPARSLPAVTRVKVLPALDVLADAPAGAVVNLPVTANRDYLYEQVLHRKPLAASLNTGANRSGLLILSALRHVSEDDRSPEEVEDAARKTGIRYVVLHKNQLIADAFLPAVWVLRNHFDLIAEDMGVRVYALW